MKTSVVCTTLLGVILFGMTAAGVLLSLSSPPALGPPVRVPITVDAAGRAQLDRLVEQYITNLHLVEADHGPIPADILAQVADVYRASVCRTLTQSEWDEIVAGRMDPVRQFNLLSPASWRASWFLGSALVARRAGEK